MFPRKTIGFHCSHELYSPSELLGYVTLAERCGFDAAMCSDHFHPWVTKGHSGFAFSWLGAALQTTSLTFGSVHAPGQRYHPAISAQAVATLCQMFDKRYWVALGSGENLNENITGDPWPDKETRNRRLLESANVMRALWKGETVNHTGTFTVKNAKLYTLPSTMPTILAAAITPETAYWAGEWADGLITVGRDHEKIGEIVRAFRQGGGEGRPVALQSTVSWGTSKENATEAALRRWPICLDSTDLSDLATPEEFAERSNSTTIADMLESFRISDDLREHIEWLRGDFAIGVDAVYLHYVGDAIESMITTFAREVLPRARS